MLVAIDEEIDAILEEQRLQVSANLLRIAIAVAIA